MADDIDVGGDDKALENWVYIEPRQRLTFDSERINDHGKTHLSRSLETRKLVAVLGSGVSRTYGQPSWAALLKNTAILVKEKLEKLKENKQGGAEIRRSSDLAILRNRFEDAKLFEKAAGTEDFLVNFELCDNLFAELHLQDLERQNIEIRSRGDEIFKAKAFLRARLKWQVRDNRGRIEILLSEPDIARELGAASTLPITAKTPWRRKKIFDEILERLLYPGKPGDSNVSEAEEAYAALFALFFYKDVHDAEEMIVQLMEQEQGPDSDRLPRDLADYASKLRALRRFDPSFLDLQSALDPGNSIPLEASQAAKDGPDPIVQFVHCFDVEGDPMQKARWELHSAIDAVFAHMPEDDRRQYLYCVHVLSDALASLPRLASTLQNRARARRPAYLDPVSILHKELGIRRFVTMNYDAEIDKWLESLGFEEIVVRKDRDVLAAEHAATPPRGSRSIMVDRFNNHAEILAYEPGSAPDLFAFGVDTRDVDMRVLHMHGRIRKPESWLVMSEPDYQLRYARDAEPKAQSDDAMRLIFNANPLLFVGLGMTEHDVLKPLRAYNQAEVSLSDRPSIALLPRLGDPDKRKTEQSKAMSSYGIFNIYYGTAVSILCGETNAPSKPEDDSLKRMRDTIDAATAVVNILRASQTRDIDANARAACDRLETAVISMRETCFNGGLNSKKGFENFRRFITVESSKAHAIVVNHAANMLLRIADSLLDHFAIPEKELRRRDLLPLTFLLDGISNTVFTCFFCARLKQIIDDHASWQNDWGVASYPREKFGRASEGEVVAKDASEALESIRQVILLRNLEKEEKENRDREKDAFSDLVANGQTDRLKPLLEGGEDPAPAAPATDRFFAGHPSPAIIALRSALSSLPNSKPKRRRLFLMLGDRGDGRGHVFAAMRSSKRFAHFCDWLRLEKPEPDAEPTPDHYGTDMAARTRTARIPRAFYNLGLSHEVISVFDRLNDFLETVIKKNLDRTAEAAFTEDMRSIRADRVHRLRAILNRLNTLDSMPHTQRIVICINNIDKLFNERGEAKNAQIERLVNLLFMVDYDKVPIDFILFMNHSPLPRFLRELSERQPFHALCADPTTPIHADSFTDFLDRLKIDWFNPFLGRPGDQHGEAQVYLHKLHPMRPITFALRFFPKVAFALYYLGWLRTWAGDEVMKPTLVNYGIESEDDSETSSEDVPRPRFAFPNYSWKKYSANLTYQKSLRDAFDAVLKISNKETERVHYLARHFAGGAVDMIALAVIHEHFERRSNLEDVIPKCIADGAVDSGLKNRKIDQRRFNTTYLTNFISIMLGQRAQDHGKYEKYYPSHAGLKPYFFMRGTAGESVASEASREGTNIGQVIGELSHYFDALYRVAGRNRYCLTLIMSAIDDMIERRLNSYPRGCVQLIPVTRFMDRLSMACSSLSAPARVEAAIAQVLLNYKTDTVNSYSTPMAAWPREFMAEIFRANPDKGGDDIKADDGPAADKEEMPPLTYIKCMSEVETWIVSSLQETILATMSLIGQPVTPEALLGVERVAAAFTQLFRSIEARPAFLKHGKRLTIGEMRNCVKIVLDLLVHRCLVFRLFPKNNPKKEEYHFAVHSSLRRYYLSNMNAHNVDYATIDQLTVSIYSSQPNDMPKPSAETNRRIRHLIEGLSQYENHPCHAFDDPYVVEKESPDRLAEISRSRLRAAFGALRSFYSVAVVSRFSSYQDEGIHPPELGYFEIHRRRVRWLLRKAYTLDNLDHRGKAASEKQRFLYTFYAEEQVWLYNECGVISLAQGRVDDAVGLFIQAKRVAKNYIESLGWGALHAAVDLNLAVAKIDVGQLREARSLLERIRDDRHETKTMKALARGYLAWIKGLQGDLGHAETALQTEIEILIQEDMFRAAALLMIHRADVLIQIGKARFEEAERVLISARSLSSNGGHEDIRQLSLVAYYRLLAAKYEGVRDRKTKELIQQGLVPLKDYAEIMNMPRIACGVALVEAHLFLNEDEYQTASRAAQQALLIATRHNLELAKIDAMYILGSALLKEGAEEARGLLIRARELAIHAEYNAKINGIELALSKLPAEP